MKIKSPLLTFGIVFLFAISFTSAENICQGDSCYYHGELGINFNTAVCGNNITETGEQCDTNSLPTNSCTNYLGSGWTGTLSCTSKCTFDTSGCSNPSQSNQASNSASSSKTNNNGVTVTNQAPEEIPLVPGINIIKKGPTYIFGVETETHRLKLEDVNNVSIILNISSNPMQVDLEINSSKELDVNEDSKPEVALGLEKIIDPQTALVYFGYANSTTSTGTTNSNPFKPNFGAIAIILVAIILVIYLLSRGIKNTKNSQEPKDAKE